MADAPAVDRTEPASVCNMERQPVHSGYISPMDSVWRPKAFVECLGHHGGPSGGASVSSVAVGVDGIIGFIIRDRTCSNSYTLGYIAYSQ